MKNTIIYPGTFDPITNGHVDIIVRATKLFDRVVVAIAASTNKKPFFTLKKRVELAKKVLSEHQKVEVMGFDNLLIEFAKKQGASAILRGLRAVADFDFEFQLAGMNRKLDPTIETLFMAPSEETRVISSSLVREIAELGGNVSSFVHPVVVKALKK
ncbi:MAG: pantetheine-phosphate adenylyltransferase [Proteobacteria bacterium]|nr:pantetheine-phosphate adenylyltransferase [Pseudomonadota bacterium]